MSAILPQLILFGGTAVAFIGTWLTIGKLHV